MEQNYPEQETAAVPETGPDGTSADDREGAAEAQAAAKASNESDARFPAADVTDASGAVGPESIIEALLFSSDVPLAASKLAVIVGALSAREIRALVESLNADYARWNRSFQIQEIAGGYQMMTRPEFAPYLHQLHKVRSEGKLSPAALETLAVVAYKQPVLRAEVEAIRGVACGEMIRALMEKDLIKIVGRAEELGRPMLYGTTKRFMQVFGLASMDDLPQVPELMPPKRAGVDSPVPAEESPTSAE